MGNEAFPFRAAREIDIGFARVLCIRITYLGELGYELYIPTEQALHVYDRLVEAGERVGLVHAGLKTLASAAWRRAIATTATTSTTPTRCSRPASASRPISRSRAASSARTRCVAQKAAGPLKKRLLQILVKDPEPMLFHAEPVLRDGKPVGYIRAASYGHTLGGAVGLAMIDGATTPIDAKWIEAGTLGGRDREQAVPGDRIAQAAVRCREQAREDVAMAPPAPVCQFASE